MAFQQKGNQEDSRYETGIVFSSLTCWQDIKLKIIQTTNVMDLLDLIIALLFVIVLAGLVFLVVKGFKRMYGAATPCGECGKKLDHKESCIYFHDDGAA